MRCEGRKEVSCGRSGGNKAAKTTLLGLLCSSMSAKPPPKSRGKWEAVSVVSPLQAAAIPPTWSIGFRRARLLTSAAERLSPQTCFRLPHCLGRFAPCGFSRPPARRLADQLLPRLIVLPIWILMVVLVLVVMVGMENRSASAGVLLLMVSVFLYIEI